MRIKAITCVLLLSIILSLLIGTTAAYFTDIAAFSATYTMGHLSLAIQSRDMGCVPPIKKVVLTNTGTMTGSLYLKNIYRADYSSNGMEMYGLIPMDWSDLIDDVTISVEYAGNAPLSFNIHDLDNAELGYLLVASMSPYSSANVDIKQNCLSIFTKASEQLDETDTLNKTEPALPEMGNGEISRSEETDPPELSQSITDDDHTDTTSFELLSVSNEEIENEIPTKSTVTTSEADVVDLKKVGKQPSRDNGKPKYITKQCSIYVPYVFEFELVNHSFTATQRTTFTLVKLFSFLVPFDEKDSLMSEAPDTLSEDDNITDETEVITEEDTTSSIKDTNTIRDTELNTTTTVTQEETTSIFIEAADTKPSEKNETSTNLNRISGTVAGTQPETQPYIDNNDILDYDNDSIPPTLKDSLNEIEETTRQPSIDVSDKYE